ncbi:hypothetical protein CMV_017146 [Castanea mollissima]|uniref:Large ribosomal subunit protein bL28m n=1 Tax=Castanea mollissima TaxID=60419 RepID=A0A8J4VQW1_9ROSI|nr:hypothetical protein CMV_017146 [Castanea mollissima]
MAFRGKEMMKKVLKNVGEKNLAPGLKASLKKCIPDSKVVMGRAKRGLYAGRHIQFGNRVSEDGGNKSRRAWKPNVQEKRLFSYVLDRHVLVKVTTHALCCFDKAGGIDEYLLKTPDHKIDTEMGLYWKSRIEKMYEELGKRQVVFFSPEDEARFEQRFKDLKVAKRTARRDARRQMPGCINQTYAWRSILQSREVIHKGAVWIVGDGWMIDIWSHKWLPDLGQSRVILPRNGAGVEKGYINTGHPLAAIAAYEEILRLGLKPDKLTYNKLIYACVKTDKLDIAMHALEEMKDTAQKFGHDDLFPDVVTYTTLLKGLALCKDLL